MKTVIVKSFVPIRMLSCALLIGAFGFLVSPQSAMALCPPGTQCGPEVRCANMIPVTPPANASAVPLGGTPCTTLVCDIGGNGACPPNSSVITAWACNLGYHQCGQSCVGDCNPASLCSNQPFIFVPPNATAITNPCKSTQYMCPSCYNDSTFVSGWYCNAGFHQCGNSCVANCTNLCGNNVSVPANATPITTPCASSDTNCPNCMNDSSWVSGWTCNAGYVQVGPSCQPISIYSNCTAKPSPWYTTDWNTVDGIWRTWNGSSYQPAPNTVYNTAPSSTECRFKCRTNYSWTGSVCEADTRAQDCAGGLPTNAIWNDGAVPDGKFEQTWTWGGSSHSWQPASMDATYDTSIGICHFKCPLNYTWNGSSCEQNTQPAACSGSLPTNAFWNDGPAVPDGYFLQTWTGSWTPASKNAVYSTTVDECHYACNTNYTWDGDSCEPDRQPGVCTGALPDNAIWNDGPAVPDGYFLQTWNGSAWTPASKMTTYNTNVNECHFKCKPNYNWNGAACVGNTRWTICTGTPPANAYWNDGSGVPDGQFLQTYDNAWTPASKNATYSATVDECHYKCNTNYAWDGDSCEPDTRYVNCSGSLPSHASWNDGTTPDGQFEQEWNGSFWAPVSKSTTHNATIGECHFTCNTHYTWDGSVCEADTQWVNCTGSKPANTVWNDGSAPDGQFEQEWNGSAWTPLSNSPSYSTSIGECHYKCALNYNWDGDSCEPLPACGDGNVDSGEECDDGGTANGDGCSSTCQWETQLADCSPSTLLPNSLWNDGSQVDGKFTQTYNGSGWIPATKARAYNTSVGECHFKCALGFNWDGANCIAPPSCGDGTVDSGEDCDDGGTVNGDGCSSTCQWETQMAACADGKPLNSLWNDGGLNGEFTQTYNGSDWLPGNVSSEHNTAVGECHFKCALGFVWDGNSCNLPASCGDGNVDSGEDCDDGGTANGDGCSSTCQWETQLANCTGALPGNASWNDGGLNGQFTQTYSISGWIPVSKTSTHDEAAGECHFVCDANYNWNGLSCEADSQWANCSGSLPSNGVWNDGANPDGKFEQDWNGSEWQPDSILTSYSVAPGDCHFECKANYSWNNGTQTCDGDTRLWNCAGNLPSHGLWNDGTQEDGKFTQIFNGTWTPSSKNSVYNATVNECHFICDSGYAWDDENQQCYIPANCGNGTVDGSEECDDGGTVPGDGCSEICEWETRWAICSGALPTDARWNDGINPDGKFEQQYTGSTWQPPTMLTSYNPIISECAFVCKSGYNWDIPTQKCVFNPSDDAHFDRQDSVSPTMIAGRPYVVTVAMENTGTTEWTDASGYHLGSKTPTDWNLPNGTSYDIVPLESSDAISNGQKKAFTFTITAPSVAGDYDFQWQMQKGSTWFGETSPLTTITVEDGCYLDNVSASANPTSGVSPLSVSFTGEGEKAGNCIGYGDVTYSWDLDGDKTEDSALQNPVYSYTTDGTYQVTYTVAVENTIDPSDVIEETDTLVINVGGYSSNSPMEITEHKWVCGTAVNEAGYAGVSAPTEFLIDKVDPFVTVSSVNPGTTVTSPDTITVSLIAEDTLAGIDEAKFIVNGLQSEAIHGESFVLQGKNLAATAEISTIGTNNKIHWWAKDIAGNTAFGTFDGYEIQAGDCGDLPKASILASPPEGDHPLDVAFFGTVEFCNDDPNIAEFYEWDFDGDGFYDLPNSLDPTSTLTPDMNKYYTYTVPGTYTVKLRATKHPEVVTATLDVIVIDDSMLFPWAGNCYNSAYGQDMGWVIFGNPLGTDYEDSFYGVNVSDIEDVQGHYAISGEAFSENFGVINFNGTHIEIDSGWGILRGQGRFNITNTPLYLSRGNVNCAEYYNDPSVAPMNVDGNGMPTDFGVCIDPNTGHLYGYAWSEEFGWLKFMDVGAPHIGDPPVEDMPIADVTYQTNCDWRVPGLHGCHYSPDSWQSIQKGQVISWLKECGPEYAKMLVDNGMDPQDAFIESLQAIATQGELHDEELLLLNEIIVEISEAVEMPERTIAKTKCENNYGVIVCNVCYETDEGEERCDIEIPFDGRFEHELKADIEDRKNLICVARQQADPDGEGHSDDLIPPFKLDEEPFMIPDTCPCLVEITAADANPTQEVAPVHVQFAVSARSADCLHDLHFRWEFGDGDISSEQNPLHLYDEPDIYRAKVTVSRYDPVYEEWVSAEETILINVAHDTEGPTVIVDGHPNGVPDAWTNATDIEAEILCSDNASGCDGTSIKYLAFVETFPPEGPPKSCPENYGEYTKTYVPGSRIPVTEWSFLCAAAKDNQNNEGFSEIQEFQVDKIKPTLTADPDPDDPGVDPTLIEVTSPNTISVLLTPDDLGGSKVKFAEYVLVREEDATAPTGNKTNETKTSGPLGGATKGSGEDLIIIGGPIVIGGSTPSGPVRFTDPTNVDIVGYGTYSIEWYIEDNAGNFDEGIFGPYVILDGEEPFVEVISKDYEKNGATWQNIAIDDAFVHCEDEVPGSGCDELSFGYQVVPIPLVGKPSIICSLDPADYTPIDAFSHIPEIGEYSYVCAMASDNAGNTGFSDPKIFQVDQVLPWVDADPIHVDPDQDPSIIPPTTPDGFITVTLTPNDDGGSGVDHAEFVVITDTGRPGGGLPKITTFTEPYTFDITGYGLHTIEWTAYDIAGNTQSDSFGLYVIADGLAPDVAVLGAPTGWQNSPADAEVFCDDHESQCDETTFRFKTYTEANIPRDEKGNPYCEEDYALYPIDAMNAVPITENIWVCATAKDVDTNVGFSDPVFFQVDLQYPGVTATPKSGSVVSPNTIDVSITSFDNGGSGLSGSMWNIIGVPNPILEYKFNGTFKDTSGSNNHGVNHNGVTFDTGFNGESAAFEYPDVEVRTENVNVDVNPGAYNTVSFWMFWDGSPGGVPLDFDSYRLWFPSDANCFGFNRGAGDCYGMEQTNLARKWVHVTAVFFNGTYTNASEIYINGTKQSLTQVRGDAGSVTVTPDIAIGGYRASDQYSFGGQIDEFRVFNRKLSEDEIVWDFLRGSLAAEYELNNTPNDTSGNSRDGVEGGSMIYRDGRFSGAGSFDGVDDYVNIGTWDMSGYEEITVSAWFATSDSTNPMRIVSKEQQGTPGAFSLGFDGSNWYFNVYDGKLGGTRSATYASTDENDGNWHYIAGVLRPEDDKMYLYMDGVEVAESDFGGTGIVDTEAEEVVIGADSDLTQVSEVFNGAIDRVRIYEKGLTASEITKDYEPFVLASGTSFANSFTVPISGYGTYYLEWEADDNAGNVSFGSYGPYIITDGDGPNVIVTGDPLNWQNRNAIASATCYDAHSGCDRESIRMLLYDTEPTSCPTTYGDYLKGIPETISSQKWVCAAALDAQGNAGFSTYKHFKVDKINPVVTTDIENGSTREPDTINPTLTPSDTGGSLLKDASYWLKPNPLLEYSFENAFEDDSGNGRPGIKVDDIDITSSGKNGTGNALTTEKEGYIQVGGDPIDFENFYFSVWVIGKETRDPTTIASFRDGTTGDGWHLGVNDRQQLEVTFYTDGGDPEVITLDDKPADGSWHYVSLFYDNGKPCLAMDLENEICGNPVAMEGPYDTSFIGGGIEESWIGLIDEVNLYDRILSAQEIKVLSNNGKYIQLYPSGSQPFVGKPGSYQLKYLAHDNATNEKRGSFGIYTIIPECKLAIKEVTADPSQGLIPLRVQFKAQISDTDCFDPGGRTYLWDFDDNGNTSTEAEPQYEYAVDETTYTVTLTVAQDGKTAVSDVEVRASRDTTPPTVTLDTDLMPSEWTTDAHTAKVVCEDDHQTLECRSDTYRVLVFESDPGTCPTTYSSYEDPAPNSYPDEHSVGDHLWVCAAAKDFARNTGFTKTPYEFTIDITPPTLDLTNIPGSWVDGNTGVVGTIICTDDDSGCKQKKYKIFTSDPGDCTTANMSNPSDGPSVPLSDHVWVCIGGDDAVGNRTLIGTPFEILIDNDPPVVTASPIPGEAGSTSTTPTPLNITLNYNDSGESGVANNTYTVDGTAASSGNGSTFVSGKVVTFANFGSYSISYWAVDSVGNEATGTFEFYEVYDGSPPTVEVTGDPADWQKSAFATVTCSDDESGCPDTNTFKLKTFTEAEIIGYGSTCPNDYGLYTVPAGSPVEITTNVYVCGAAKNGANTPVVGFSTPVLFKTEQELPSASADPAGPHTENGTLDVEITATDTGGSGVDESYYYVVSDVGGEVTELRFEDNFNDSSGNGNDGIFTGNVSFEDGLHGKTAYFDGSGDWIDFADLGNPVDGTMAFWFKTPNKNVQRYLMEGRPDGGWWLIQDYEGSYCSSDTGGNICFYAKVMIPSADISNDTWHYVVVTSSTSDGVKIYLDGQLKDSNPSAINIDFSTVRVGARYSASNAFLGNIDEVKIFHRALTQDEISAEYNRYVDYHPQTTFGSAVTVPLSVFGTHNIYWGVTDNAGNKHGGDDGNGLTFGPYTIQEGNPPDVTVHSSQTGGKWNNRPVTVTIGCTDGESGCDNSSKRYKLYPGSSPGACPLDYDSYIAGGEVEISELTYVCGAAKDKIGNAGFSIPVIVRVDRDLPDVAANPTPPTSEIIPNTISVDLTPSDTGGSGLLNASYAVRNTMNDPIAYWNFDNDQVDATGNGYDATSSAAITYGEGRNGSAAIFNGTDSIVEIDDGPVAVEEVSVFSWIKPLGATATNYQRIVCGPNEYFCYWLNNDGSVAVRLDGTTRKDTSLSQISFNDVPVPFNEWSHVGFTYDGANTYLYINGQKYIATQSSGGSDYYSGPLRSTVGTLYIGGRGGTNRPFYGHIDEVKIYRNALSETDVLDLYNEASLMMHLNFEDTCTDTSGNGNDCTLQNGAVYHNGHIGKGILLDGQNDQAVILDSEKVSPENITVSFWANVNETGAWQHFIAKDNAFHIRMSYVQGIQFGIQTTGGYKSCNASSTIPYNTWKHFVLTYDGTTIKAYIDGVEDLSCPHDYPGLMNDSTSPLYLSKPGYPVKGQMDEVRIYDRAFSATEVSNLYTRESGHFGTDFTSANTITLSDAGVHYIDWIASDNAGNQKLGSYGPYTIADITGPVITVSGDPTSWQNANASVSMSCTDENPGCNPASMKYRIYNEDPSTCPLDDTGYNAYGGGSITIDDHVWFCGYAKDWLDNIGVSDPVEVQVDKHDPDVHANLTSSSASDPGTITVQMTAYDNEYKIYNPYTPLDSGLDHAEYMVIKETWDPITPFNPEPLAVFDAGDSPENLYFKGSSYVPEIIMEGDDHVYRVGDEYKSAYFLNEDGSLLLLPVNTGKQYKISGQFKSMGEIPSRVYFGYRTFDKNKNIIDGYECARSGNPGTIESFSNTEIVVTETLTGWNAVPERATKRNLAFYYDGNTDNLADYVYTYWPGGSSSTAPEDGAYSSVSGNTIFVNSDGSGLPQTVQDNIILGTTVVMNHYSQNGNLYFPASAKQPPIGEWTTYEGILTGEDWNAGYNVMRPHTKYIQPLLLLNYNAQNTTEVEELYYDDLVFEEYFDATDLPEDTAVMEEISGPGVYAINWKAFDNAGNDVYGTYRPYTIVRDAVCGSANGVAVYNAPTTDLCGDGSTPYAYGDGPFTWTCLGSYGGTNASCSAPKMIDGSCGVASGSSYYVAPASDLCSEGTPTIVTGSGPWYWTCTGVNGGINDPTCYATLTEDGVCGERARNYAFDETDYTTGSFCDVGAANPTNPAFPTKGGTSNWSCEGVNGGIADNCLATRAEDPIDGQCGSASGSAFYSAPSANLCTDGEATAVSGAGPWTWTCEGLNGGADDTSCLANLKVDGVCGSADGIAGYTAPDTNLCSVGNPTAVSGTGPWSWTCQGIYGGTGDVCTASLIEDGVCGSANGTAHYTTPSSNLCSVGTMESMTGSGPWNWHCTGVNGGATNTTCSAPKKQDGVCGSADGVATYSAPAYDDQCSIGSPTPISGTGPFTWGCMGINGGNQSSCSAPLIEDGQCGPASGSSYPVEPTVGLCSVGSDINMSGSGPWTWHCTGVNGGTPDTSCSANKKEAGMCGSAHGSAYYSAPTTNLCDIGTATAVSGSGPFTWTCLGPNGGDDVNCSANKKEDALCGASDGSNFYTEPTTDLCDVGSPTTVNGSGPWTWNCDGVNGGDDASCSANLSSNGLCGDASGSSYYSAPSADLCSNGTPSSVAGLGPWSWTCYGINGGTNDTSCVAAKKIDAACGSSHGGSFYTEPSSDLCNYGSPGSVTNNGLNWNWLCTGVNGGVNANCDALYVFDGSCGPADGTPTYAEPTSGFCSVGTPTAVSGSGPWTWNCNGQNGGSNDSCSAPKTEDGVCGSANGSSFYSTPTANLCDNGSASAVTGSGPWNWDCTGPNGGATVACSALKKEDGICGSANGTATYTKPTANLCDNGSESTVTGSGPWNWDCNGVNGGNAANCSAPKITDGQCGDRARNIVPGEETWDDVGSEFCSAGNANPASPVFPNKGGSTDWDCQGINGGTTANCTATRSEDPINGSCGSANGQSYYTTPTANLCSSGTASTVTGSGPWTWDCMGANGGEDSKNCSATLKIDGICGSSHNGNFLSEPTTNLCSVGSASAVSGTGPWSWTCYASNGGVDASCLANLTVNASCGSADGVAVFTKPTTNLCSTGNPSGVDGSGPWTWTCNGLFGGTNDSCSAPLKVNGACGGADGTPSYTEPTTNLCSSGTPTAVSGSGPWTWSCNGQNGGSNDSCSAPKTEDGACGAADGNSFYSTPSSNLCDFGTASPVSGSGPWTWTCPGENGGSTDSCSAQKKEDGVCGSSDGGAFYSQPTTNLCTNGTASSVTGSGPWSWSCMGINGGNADSCSAILKENGQCGSAHGTPVYSIPTSNLCIVGTASAIAGTGPWSWTCSGVNGGNTSSTCEAPKKLDGTCGSADGSNFYTKPTTNLCSSGTPSSVDGSGPWTWTCQGAEGGSNDSCSAEKSVDGACGSSDGGNYYDKPTSGLCDVGTATTVTGTGPWYWSCPGKFDGITDNCSAQKKENAVCGSAHGTPVYVEPSSNLCSVGSDSTVSGSGPWSWTCTGLHGGNNASCSAPLITDGVCGTRARNHTYAETAWNGSETFCTAGNASPASPTFPSTGGSTNWTCGGINGGTNDNCTATRSETPINGDCGSSDGGNFYSAPTANLCNSGTATTVTGSGPWSWSCTGSFGGTTDTCSANKKVDGSCGSANGTATYTIPTTNLCNVGGASSVTGSGPWNWTCSGQNGGNVANCSAPLKVNGVCGSADGGNFYSQPSSGLCSSGNASSVAGSGPWTWTCNGINGGTGDSCSANLKQNAVCGAAHGVPTNTKPASHLCSVGGPSSVAGSGPWTWTCYGINTGNNANCSAPYMFDGVCGDENKREYDYNDTEWESGEFCSPGTANPSSPVFPSPGNTTTWSCVGQNGGSSDDCGASRKDDKTPPVVGITGAPGSWQNTPASAIITCNDSESGCKDVYISVVDEKFDNCKDTVAINAMTAYTAPVSVTDTSWVCGYATDNAGNDSLKGPVLFKVDSTAPTRDSLTISSDYWYINNLMPDPGFEAQGEKMEGAGSFDNQESVGGSDTLAPPFNTSPDAVRGNLFLVKDGVTGKDGITNVARSGSFSMRHNAEADLSAGSSVTGPNWKGVSVKPVRTTTDQRRFTFSAWGRANAANTQVRIFVFCRNSSNDVPDASWYGTSGWQTIGTSWAELRSTFECPVGTSYAGVRMDIGTPNGIVWWDDLDLSYVYEIAATATDTASGVKTIKTQINVDSDDNSANTRGLFGWSESSYLFSGDQVICDDGSKGSKRHDGYNPDTITLVGCNSTNSNGETVATFYVAPDATFDTFGCDHGSCTPTGNDISFYTTDWATNATNWLNYDLDFTSDGVKPYVTAEKADKFSIKITINDDESGPFAGRYVIDGTASETNGTLFTGTTTVDISGLTESISIWTADKAGNTNVEKVAKERLDETGTGSEISKGT